MKKKNYLLLWLIAFLILPVYTNAEVIEGHSTDKRTKDEVVNAYLDSLSQTDYTQVSYYDENPIFTGPSYYEGVLNSTIKSDVLKQYNFYRYLSGLNTVTINEDKMARSGKAALLLTVNNVLTHWLSQPADMNDAFYQEAYNGANALGNPGDTYFGNVAWNTTAEDMVKAYVDDSSNVKPNVGHRASMLSPYAKSISFGYAKMERNREYGAISVYYDSVNNNIADTYYAWPPAGYVPTEAFPVNEKTMWSVWLDGGYTFNKTLIDADNQIYTTDIQVTLEYDGKTYTPDQVYYSYHPNNTSTVYYYFPSELNAILLRSNEQYVVDKPIKVTLSNMHKAGEDMTITYTTTFVQAQTILPTEVNIGLKTDPNATSFRIYSGGMSMDVNAKYYYVPYILPANATTGNLEVVADDTTVLKVDTKNKTITPLKNGTTKLTIRDTLTGGSSVLRITVTGEKVPVEELELIGDFNQDGVVDLSDVYLLLRVSLRLDEATEEQKVFGDINKDEIIDLSDVYLALRMSLRLSVDL